MNSSYYQFYPPAYGYLWWLDFSMDVYQALGSFGQRIMVSPREDMVVVFTASIPRGKYHPQPELYTDYIQKAIIGPPKIVEPNITTTTTSTTTISSTATSTTTSGTANTTIVTNSTELNELLIVVSVSSLIIVTLIVISKVLKKGTTQ